MRKILWLALLCPLLATAQTAMTVVSADTVQAGCVLGAANATCVLPMKGQHSAGFVVTAISSPVGITLVTETSRDGTSWDGHNFIDVDNNAALASIPNTSLAVGFTRSLQVGLGVRFVRVRTSAWTSGSATVTMTGSQTVPYPTPVIARIRPADPGVLGCYQVAPITGTMAAALAAGSPIFSFRWTLSTSVAVVTHINVAMNDLTTAFAAGVGKFTLQQARSFSASDTGGTAVTLTTNNGKKQTSFATTGVGDMRMSSTATLTAGTRTLDATFTSQILYQVTTTANQVMLPSANGDLWNSDTGGGSVYPLVFAANEGFIINATVPATGTWNGVVVVEWCELATFP